MTRPYLIIAPDDHRIFVRWEWHVQAAIERYRLGHPYFLVEDFVAIPISVSYYRKWLRNKHNPIWWILEQGDPLDRVSEGRKELLVKMVRNIPPIP